MPFLSNHSFGVSYHCSKVQYHCWKVKIPFLSGVVSDFSVSPKLLLIKNSIFMSKLHPELLQVLQNTGYMIHFSSVIFSHFLRRLLKQKGSISLSYLLFKKDLLEHLCCILDNSLDFVQFHKRTIF